MVALGLVTTEHLEGESVAAARSLPQHESRRDAAFVFVNRNPDEEAGEEEEEYGQPGVQRPVRARGQRAPRAPRAPVLLNVPCRDE